MKLVRFLNNLFKKGGFVLIDSNSKKYIIGNPDNTKPLILKLLDKKLNYKLLINPDLYFGEAYTNGTLVIENGTITDFLELAFKNIGRNEINLSGYFLKKMLLIITIYRMISIIYFLILRDNTLVDILKVIVIIWKQHKSIK